MYAKYHFTTTLSRHLKQQVLVETITVYMTNTSEIGDNANI